MKKVENMTGDKAWRWGMRLGGWIVLLIGLGHVVMPKYGYKPDATEGWSPETIDHFYYLATYFICGVLVAVGVLSLVFSGRRPGRDCGLFAVAMAALFTFRLILEIRYPVALPIFALDKPHRLLLIPLSLTALGYLTAVFAAFRTLPPHGGISQ